MEIKTVQFIRQRNCQSIAKDKVVRLRHAVFEGGEQAPMFRDVSRAELDAGYAFALSG